MAQGISLEFEFRNQRFNDAERGLKAFVSQIRRDWDGSAKVLSIELRQFLDDVAKAMVERHSNPWPGGTTPQTLSKRSGKLLQSIVSSVNVRGTTFTTIQGFIGGSHIARVQEFGATITPKRAKFLTVPLPAALNENGTPKKQKARDWKNTFVAKSKAGNLIIFQKRGTKIIPLYLLKTSVTIPPRLGLRRTLEVGIPYFVDRAMDSIVRAVRG